MFSLIFLTLLLNAQPKPPCSHNVITRNCEFFKERKNTAFIEVKSGIGFSNPLYEMKPTVTSTSNTYSGEKSQKDSEEYFDRLLLSQAEILEALEGTPVSSKAKLSLATQLHQILTYPDIAINIAWPLSDKAGKIRGVEANKISTALQSLLGNEKFNELSQVAKKYLDGEIQKVKQEQDRILAENKKLEAIQEEKLNFIQDNQKRINELFSKAKQSIIDIIKQGQPESSLPKEKQQMINKVNLIKLNNLDTNALSPACGQNSDNAFYSPGHTVTLCPGSLNSTDEKILLLLAHEIAHSIDACHALMPLWKVDTEKLNQLLDNPQTPSAIRQDILISLRPNQEYFNYDPELVFSLSETTQFLLEHKVFAKIQNGSAPSNYAYKKEAECLVNESKFRSIEDKDIKNTEEAFKKSSQDEKDNATFSRYISAMKKYPQCFKSLAYHSQLNETTSDMLASLVLEKHLIENPPVSEAAKVGAIDFAHGYCTNNSLGEKIKSSAPILTSGIMFQALSGPHPSSSSRVDKVFLNLPGMAEIYNCSRIHKGCADHLSFYNRSKKSLHPTNTGVSK